MTGARREPRARRDGLNKKSTLGRIEWRGIRLRKALDKKDLG